MIWAISEGRSEGQALTTIFLVAGLTMRPDRRSDAKKFQANTYPLLNRGGLFQHRKYFYPLHMLANEKIWVVDLRLSRLGSDV